MNIIRLFFEGAILAAFLLTVYAVVTIVGAIAQ